MKKKDTQPSLPEQNPKGKKDVEQHGWSMDLKKLGGFFRFFKFSELQDRWKAIGVFSALAFLLVVILVGLAVFKDQKPSVALIDVSAREEERDTLPEGMAYRRLDGVLVPKEQSNLWPVAVMIDNIAKSEVRDQAGLSAASLVYETYVEGRITRMMPIFAGEQSEKIGPVRSSRHYFLDWVSEVDAVYGHEGGSPEALSAISSYGIRDLHQGRNSKYYWRDRSGYAPHNLFTSTELLSRAVRDSGLETTAPTYISWKFKEDRPMKDRPEGEKVISIPFNSSASYLARYLYDREQNSYLRFFGEQVYTDRNTGKQIQAKNVIVQFVPQPTYLSSGKGRIDLEVIGEGKTLIFSDGGANVGTWKKPDRTTRTTYFYETGAEVEFNRGSTWIAVVLDDIQVDYN